MDATRRLVYTVLFFNKVFEIYLIAGVRAPVDPLLYAYVCVSFTYDFVSVTVKRILHARPKIMLYRYEYIVTPIWIAGTVTVLALATTWDWRYVLYACLILTWRLVCQGVMIVMSPEALMAYNA